MDTMEKRTMNEKLINVPLDDETKAALERRAEANGRATTREAAQIIKDAVGTAPKPEDTP